MNLRKLKNQDGFTLVELIVVIAIMAILAGVAVPVYSGYIEKANKAADLQLLGAVNSAFSAACFENGATDMTKVDASITLGGNEGAKTIQNVSASADGLDGANVPISFTKYFAGNENSVFKVIEELKFENGVFKDKNDVVNTKYPQGAGMTDGEIAAAVGKYENSNMAGNEESLVNSVDTLADMFATRLETDGLGLLTGAGGMSQEELDAFMDKYNLTQDSPATDIANSMVMHMASTMKDVSSQDILNAAEGDLKNNIDKVAEKYGVIQTYALMYGVATGYANSDYASADFKQSYNSAEIKGIGDVQALLGEMMSDDGLNSYYTADEKNTMSDIDGFLAAMEVVNNYEGQFDLSNPDVFKDSSTQELLESILGTSN